MHRVHAYNLLAYVWYRLFPACHVTHRSTDQRIQQGTERTTPKPAVMIQGLFEARHGMSFTRKLQSVEIVPAFRM